MSVKSKQATSERFMAILARQANDNEVIGIDAESFVQHLLLFEHFILPTVWLKDVQFLLRMAEPRAFCELIDSGAISFYCDSATVAETGQVRSKLNLTGNTTHLNDNEFSFSTLKARDEAKQLEEALTNLAATEGVPKKDAMAVAERVEGAMHASKGLEIHSESFKGFHRDLRASESTTLKHLISVKLNSLGVKPSRLIVTVEEFVEEDFRIVSNLQNEFGLSSKKTREITQGALFDLLGVHIRLAHMNHFSALLGMNDKEKVPWDSKIDQITRNLVQDGERGRQFTRVAKIAGIGEGAFISNKKLDLMRLMDVRQSDDLVIFKNWLKQTDRKSDQEIRNRVSSIRAKIGNASQSTGGKAFRLLLSLLPNFIPDPALGQVAGTSLSVADSFLLEKLFPKDAIVAILLKDYPSMFRK